MVTYWAVEGLLPATGVLFRVKKVLTQAAGVVNPVAEVACQAIMVVNSVVEVMYWGVVGLSRVTVASGIRD